MREWLTVIIVLLIVGVVLDGLRRMRQSRRSAIRLSRNVTRNLHRTDSETAPVEETYGSELPRGGARVVNVRRPDDAKQFNRQLRENLHRKKRTVGRSYRIPEQVTLNLDEQVPTLMESVSSSDEADAVEDDTQTTASPDYDDGRIEPSFSIDDATLDSEPQVPDNGGIDAGVREADAVAPASTQTEQPAREAAYRDSVTGNVTGPATTTDSLSANTRAEDPPSHAHTAARWDHDQDDQLDDQATDDEDQESYREPDLVLVINVMAPQGERFDGESLLNVVLEQGMRFGTMNIFHRHEQANGEGPILYSMANIVVPGTFDLNTMKQFSTPGVSLFQALPLEADSLDAFEKMLATAQAITRQLGGELKDENRSVMTPQTIEHYRGRIREYERKQLSRAPA